MYICITQNYIIMTRLEAIADCKKQLASVKSPFLSQESIECVDDAYQTALETGWYKDELRGEIELYENMTDEEYDEKFNQQPISPGYEPRCRFGESDGHGGIDEEEYPY